MYIMKYKHDYYDFIHKLKKILNMQDTKIKLFSIVPGERIVVKLSDFKEEQFYKLMFHKDKKNGKFIAYSYETWTTKNKIREFIPLLIEVSVL